MLALKLLSLFFVFSQVSPWEDTSELTLQLWDGKILGRYMTSEKGRPIKAFLGIPYGKPPIGDLRFVASQRADPWDGIRRCQTDAPKCTQIAARGIEGQEDCLFLNVYVPRGNVPAQMPVVFFIYGGGFTFGEGSYSHYPPDYLLDNDVILVTGNYRLGPLGFLSTEDTSAPGNAGLKDQQLMLQWIQQNIEFFGGNKSSVTIWGESAGSISVNLQMMSPLSQGLFHKAISHSGTINLSGVPARKGEALESAKNLAAHFGCPTTDTLSAVNCLRNVSASDLMQFPSPTGFPVKIVVEDFNSLEAPFISSRDFYLPSVDIPWIVGINSEEWLATSYGYYSNATAMNLLIAMWDSVLPSNYDYAHHNQITRDEITKSINRFYFGNEVLTNPLNSQKLTELFSDVFILMMESLRDRFQYQSGQRNTFVYLYSHKGSASFGPNADEFQGTEHVDNLIVAFPMHKSVFFSSIPTKEDRELYTMIPMAYANFAKNGSPSISGIPTWPVATSIPFDYMTIGNENGRSNLLFKVKNGLYVDRANFWMNLRETYQLNRWKYA